MHNQLSRQQVFSLKHQVVRDLAWSLWGPALFLHPSPYSEIKQTLPLSLEEPYFPIDESWLIELDQDPQHLIDYLELKNTRLLGTYFERLWQFYFSHHPSFESCLCNLQVNDAKKTLGEFDVLVTDQHGQSYHIELACKFYLAWQDSQCTSQSINKKTILWIGPNCGDRLDIKFHKTSSHQLPLLKTDLGKKACELEFGPSENIQQLAIWRGHSFHFSHRCRVSEMEHKQALQALQALRNNSEILWFIAPKKLWLSPIIQHKKALKNYIQIQLDINEHFQQTEIQKPHTLMLIALAFDDDNQQWQQQERYFITPDDWPYGKLSDSALTPLRPCKPPL